MMFGQYFEMKHFFLMALLLHSISSYPQRSNPEYNAQSKKISRLLSERKAKFDQYQSSLSHKSGIFGSKTKKDVQQSVDILTDIVETDNIILRETKTLLGYKDLEKTQVENKASEAENRLKDNQNAVDSIKKRNLKLAAQTQMLKALAEEWRQQKYRFSIFIFVLGLTGLGLLLDGYRKNTK